MKREDPIVNSAIQKALRAGVSGSKASCPDDNRLNAYLENRLSQHERDRTEAHLAGCSHCQEIISLSITLAAPESEAVDEASPHPRKTVLFHLSLPISALALIIVAVAAGILFFRTPALRKAEAPAQMAEARRTQQIPQAAPEAPRPARSADQELRDKPATPAASSELRANEPKDEKARVVEESKRKDATVPAPPAETLLERAASMNEKPLDREKGKLDSYERLKAEQNTSVETPAGGGQRAVGKESDTKARGEGMQQKQQVAAPAAQVQTKVSDGDSQKKLSTAPESMLVSFAQQPLESLSLYKAPASGKVENYGDKNASNVANNRIQPARQVGSKMFYLFNDYWIDSQCRDFPKVPVVEAEESEPVFQEILKAIPEISALRSANAPVLIHWQEKNYLLRFRH